jgi:hypothetical protein
MVMDLHRALLVTPLGQPGSGRVRYGAAMALHAAGEISDAALEVYRVCAARDGQDPKALLREDGLAVPGPDPLSGEAAVGLLVDEVDRYLATLAGPGVAEVRAGLNAARGALVVPQALAEVENPVKAAWLPHAIRALACTHPALAGAIDRAAGVLRWITYDGYPREAIGAEFADGHAYAPIIGGGAPIAADDFDLGLFVIAPDVLYRDHQHAAPELYAPLTGPHGWRFAPGAPLVIKPAHMPVWNEAHQPHLTKVGPVPFLSLYGWTRDVTPLARVVPATDWPALAALRLTA